MKAYKFSYCNQSKYKTQFIYKVSLMLIDNIKMIYNLNVMYRPTPKVILSTHRPS